MYKNRLTSKTIALILSIILLLSFSSCSNEPQKDSNILEGYVDDKEFYAESESIIIVNNTNFESSSSLESDGWSEKYLSDGITGYNSSARGWSSKIHDTDDQEEWIMVDMRRTHYTDRIVLYKTTNEDGETSGFPVDFEILISIDKDVWVNIFEAEGFESDNEYETFRFAAQTIRYIKVRADKLNFDQEKQGYSLSFSEVKAYYDNYKARAKYKSPGVGTYYISSSEGDDLNDGLSPETPWKTLTHASLYKYEAGEQILLKSGDKWENQTLSPIGNGTKDSPILISSYGEGDKPLISPGYSAGYGIKINDQSGMKIKGIEFSFGIAGILAVADQTIENDFLWIQDCVFSHFESPYTVNPSNFLMPYPELYFGTGIGITAIGNQETSQKTYYRNITIIDCDFDRNDTGILNQFRDTPMHMSGYPTTGHNQFSRNSLENVIIRNVNITKSYRSGGIMLYGVTNGLIEESFVSETGFEKGMFWGVAGVQLSMCEDFLVQNSEFTKTYRSNNSPDGEGFDFESGNVNVTLYNCYIHNNQGPSILYYGQNEGWRGANEGIVIDSNILENNGEKGKFDHSKVFKNYPQNEGIIKNNIIKLNFDAQSITYEPLIFSDTNFVFEPDGTQISGPGLKKINSSDIVFKYSQGWQKITGDEFYQGEAMAANESGRSVSFNIRGNVLNVFGKNSGNETAEIKIYIDGALNESISIEPMEEVGLLYENPGLSGDVHNINLELESGTILIDSIDYFIGPKRPVIGRTNHAIDAVVEASSSEEGFGWSLDFVNNGIRNSLHPSIIGWSSDFTTDRSAQEWLLFDLKEVKSIDSIRLYAVDLSPSYFNIVMGLSFPIDFEIAVSNDKINWTPIVSETGYPQPVVKNTHTFNFSESVNGRYVRILGKRLRADPFDNNRYKMQFAEVEIIENHKN